MKKIRIAYIDFWNGFNAEDFLFTKILRKYFDLEIVSENPDFIFCSCFGRKYLNYSCPRVFYAGEPISPDFNVYDYAIGFDPIVYENRYIQYPLCYVADETMELLLKKHERNIEDILSRKKFCAMVVSSGGGYKNKRDEIYDKLSGYKIVDSGGGYRNNLQDGKAVDDKLEFLKNYKFSLATENSVYPGYVTEKIVDAWAAGTIPIYFGDRSSVRMFNPSSFVLVDGNNIENAIKRVIEIDSNEDEYIKMQQSPVFIFGSGWEPSIKRQELEDFLVNIFIQEPDDAYRRSSKCSQQGLFYEHHIQKWEKVEYNGVYKFLQNTKRSLLGNKKIEW